MVSLRPSDPGSMVTAGCGLGCDAMRVTFAEATRGGAVPDAPESRDDWLLVDQVGAVKLEEIALDGKTSSVTRNSRMGERPSPALLR